jgi:RNA polymerase sigma-70 factor, ECF subfamily
MTGTSHPSTLVGEGDPARARFHEMVTAETDTLYRLALHFTRNRADAEDLVQDTFFRAWRSFHTLQPGTNPRAWLATILRHAYFDRYRRRQREPETADVKEIDEFYLYGHMSAALEFQREAGDPATAFFAALPSDQVASTVHALQPHYREAFILADLAGFSYREISEIRRPPRRDRHEPPAPRPPRAPEGPVGLLPQHRPMPGPRCRPCSLSLPGLQ